MLSPAPPKRLLEARARAGRPRETIDEIGRENAHYFYAAGGEKFVRIPRLNDSDAGMRVIEAVVRRELQGWI